MLLSSTYETLRCPPPKKKTAYNYSENLEFVYKMKEAKCKIYERKLVTYSCKEWRETGLDMAVMCCV